MRYTNSHHILFYATNMTKMRHDYENWSWDEKIILLPSKNPTTSKLNFIFIIFNKK